ncbi:hypothetical protein I302_104538 [Kwoniella bestiolae CBS 10118]|uniref:SnoaL-like domain-containing protein n=1 Tax=Kwoniella bestiolae CBS 10118 TaxID=1296100 RepID=A0A1B9GBI9_9TREE|nr:hypothetical protein I302_03243 [Kwoniella bestiolae CBS 10118]OCF28384.1 hypothetical protein I302_03243 [Kwoniella bestiolae CBS 10118]
MTLTKEYVENIFEHGRKHEMEEMFSYIREDADFTIGNPGYKSTFVSGHYTSRSEYQKAVLPFYSLFAAPPVQVIERLLVIGNTAVCETRNEGVGKKTGQHYVNPVCIIMDFDDDAEKPRTKRVKEYFDSALIQHVHDTNKD